MPNLVVRDLDQKTIDGLKKLAKLHGTSLQEEVRGILQRSSFNIDDFIARADKIREELGAGGRVFSDSTELIREDRDR